MSAFGTFLELSIPTTDILGSLAFYRTLGFTELATGDIRRHPYAVVTDGSITIGLHGGGLDEPALAFVRPGLEQHVRSLEAAGLELDFARFGPEEFHEAALRTPDGHLLLLLEARTFPPGDEDDAPPAIIGRFSELHLPSGAPAEVRTFFENAGFLATAEEGAADIAWLTIPGLTLVVREARRGATPVLHFSATDPARALRLLQERDVPVRRTPAGHVIRAPEGTELVLVTGGGNGNS